MAMCRESASGTGPVMQQISMVAPDGCGTNGMVRKEDSERVMANENDTWIMYGVSWDDPECLHTVDEAIEYIIK